MDMRKYLVAVHKDGRITAVEYEEPQGFVYGSADAYNHALRDVKTVLEAEKTRCRANSKIDKYGREWKGLWAVRSIECEVVETAVDKLLRKS